MRGDLGACKKYGKSYRELSATCVQPKCSGRTELCQLVLNDTWVSSPTWSEDTQFVHSRKTKAEELLHKCEDERYELDVVIELNTHMIRFYQGILNKMHRMTQEDAARFRFDTCFGVDASESLHRKAVHRYITPLPPRPFPPLPTPPPR